MEIEKFEQLYKLIMEEELTPKQKDLIEWEIRGIKQEEEERHENNLQKSKKQN